MQRWAGQLWDRNLVDLRLRPLPVCAPLETPAVLHLQLADRGRRLCDSGTVRPTGLVLELPAQTERNLSLTCTGESGLLPPTRVLAHGNIGAALVVVAALTAVEHHAAVVPHHPGVGGAWRRAALC